MPRKTRTAAGGRYAAQLGFNEAAARCRGKRGVVVRVDLRVPLGFNEAAARCRGKRLFHAGGPPGPSSLQ